MTQLLAFIAFAAIVIALAGGAWWATKDDKHLNDSGAHHSRPWFGHGLDTMGDRMQKGLPKWTKKRRWR